MSSTEPSDRDIIVEFDNVSKNLGGRQILDKLNLKIRRGETFVIIGYSGTGKSVTLRHMVGLMKPDEGSIRVGGDEITTMTNKELEMMRRKFGVLFQSGALIAWLSLFENVELPLIEHTKMSKKKRKEIIREKLEIVNLWDDRNKFPAEISGGMKKRAGLARAIALDPEIIMYDEPTSGLDPVMATEIDKLINNLRDRTQVTQVVVTHDMESAYSIANRIAMFYHGEVLQVGTPDEIRNTDQPEVLHFITGGKQGRVSKRTTTAIMRGIAPGSLSRRSKEAVAKQEAEEAEAKTAVATEVASEEDTREVPSLESETSQEPRNLEPEESNHEST